MKKTKQLLVIMITVLSIFSCSDVADSNIVDNNFTEKNASQAESTFQGSRETDSLALVAIKEANPDCTLDWDYSTTIDK